MFPDKKIILIKLLKQNYVLIIDTSSEKKCLTPMFGHLRVPLKKSIVLSMLFKYSILFLRWFTATQKSSYGAELTMEKRLIDDLLRNYNKNAIPAANHTDLPIKVQLNVILRRIIEMVWWWFYINVLKSYETLLSVFNFLPFSF